MHRLSTVAAMVTALLLAADPASAQKQGGALRMYLWGRGHPDVCPRMVESPQFSGTSPHIILDHSKTCA
jgi:hypothetical protein